MNMFIHGFFWFSRQTLIQHSCEKGGMEMRSFKPEMNTEAALGYLRQIEGEGVSDVAPIDMGELSKVYSYTKNGREYVIHFKNDPETLKKVKFISDQYASCGVPMPRILAVGTCGNAHYSIAEKAAGTPVISQAGPDIRGVLPDLVRQFTRLNQIGVEPFSGFGWVRPSGEGSSKTWTEFLVSLFDEEQEGFYQGWTSLFESSFLEKDVFERIYAAMMERIGHAPEERYLVHGDFHFGNMLARDQAITGIVDWEMAMYGDFMFDLAVLHLWAPKAQFPQRVREVWAEEGRSIPYFEERLLGYQLFKGLDGLRFYAKKGDKPAYDFTKNHLFALLEQAE